MGNAQAWPKRRRRKFCATFVTVTESLRSLAMTELFTVFKLKIFRGKKKTYFGLCWFVVTANKFGT